MNLASEALPTSGAAEWTESGERSCPSISRSSGWAICDNALFALTNLGVTLAVARQTTVEEYGTFALAQSIALFLSIFHTAFITEPVLVFGSDRYRAMLGQYLSAAVLMHALMFALIEAVLGAVILTLSSLGLTLWARAFLMVAVGCPFILLGWFLRRACYIRRAPELACMAGVIYMTALFPCMGLLSRSQQLNGLSGFALMGAAAVPASLWILTRLGARGLRPHPPSWFRNMLGQHLRYGKWALGAGLTRWVPFHVPLIALASSGSISYSAALRALMTLLLPAVQLFQAVNTVLIPFCAGRSRAALRPLLARAGASEMLLAVGYSAATWLLSQPLLHVVYAGKYDSYSSYLAPLSLMLLGEAMAGVAASALQALEVPQKVFAAGLGGALVTLAGVACLRPFGVAEAVGLIVVVYVCTAVLLGICLWRMLTLGSRERARPARSAAHD